MNGILENHLRTGSGGQRVLSVRPSVSAIFLSYNCEAFVADALRSVLEQECQFPIEILVSDDASIDDTFHIIEEELARYHGPHRLIVNQCASNSGTKSAHLNRILPRASGDILVSFDGDDISERSRIGRIVERFRADASVQGVYSSLTLIDRFGHSRGAGCVPHPPPGANTSAWFARVDAYAAGSTLAVRRDVIETFGPLEPDINEDIVLPFRASLLGDVAFIDEPLVRYRRYMGSLTADMERFVSIEAYRTRLSVGIDRARRSAQSRLADIRRAMALMPDRAGQFRALADVVRDSLCHAEMTELLASPSVTTRVSALVRLMKTGAYRDELLQHACLALIPGLYLSYKRRTLGVRASDA